MLTVFVVLHTGALVRIKQPRKRTKNELDIKGKIRKLQVRYENRNSAQYAQENHEKNVYSLKSRTTPTFKTKYRTFSDIVSAKPD